MANSRCWKNSKSVKFLDRPKTSYLTRSRWVRSKKHLDSDFHFSIWLRKFSAPGIFLGFYIGKLLENKRKMWKISRKISGKCGKLAGKFSTDFPANSWSFPTVDQIEVENHTDKKNIENGRYSVRAIQFWPFFCWGLSLFWSKTTSDYYFFAK